MRKATGAKNASAALNADPASHGPPKRASPVSQISRTRATSRASPAAIGRGLTRTPTFIVQSLRRWPNPPCISQTAPMA